MSRPDADAAVVLAIGDELLSGETVDTNSSYLDARLEACGWRVVRHIAVPDDEAAIADAFRIAAGLGRLVVSTGGLGPTQDDVTVAGLARALGVARVHSAEVWAAIETRFAAFGRTPTDNNRRQAMVPQSADVLLNEVGTAPGLAARLDEAEIYVMPGVPSEVRWLMKHQVEPRIARPLPVVHRRVIKVVGMGESMLEQALRRSIDARPAVRFGFRTTGAENHVKLAAYGLGGVAQLDEAEAAVRTALGDAVFGRDHESLAEVVGAALKAAGQTVATAESCTGGWVAKRLTDVPGSSAYVIGGVVAYANEVKTAMLGVDPAVIEAHGAVSEEVAGQMAAGVRARLGTDWGLSTTGVAGPGGGTATKPVGLVWVGLAGPGGVQTRRLHRPGNRDNIRDGSVKILLHWLLNAVRASTS